MKRKKKILIILFFVNLLLFTFINYFLRKYFQPIAIVVPHHNLVQEKRLDFFKKIAQKRPKTKAIIILSPDHFSPNQFQISYADKIWQLSNGKIEYDNDLGFKIVKNLAKENGIVTNDHGIFNLLSDIKIVWPEAKIVPILIGQQLSFTALDDLISLISNNCHSDCLLIASVDFSHYLPRALADVHDEESLEALKKLEIKSEKSIEVDSPQSLFVLTKFAKNRGAKTFHFYYHSNSGKLEDSRDAETTSHFLGWYQKDLTGYNHENDTLTFLVGKNLNVELDKKTLGERFFYGVDYFNGQLEENFKPSLRVEIEPTDNFSKVNITDGLLNISLGDDLMVAGFIHSNSTHLVFLPIKKQGFANYLMQGKEKTDFFKNILLPINFGNSFFVDIKEGIVILEHRK